MKYILVLQGPLLLFNELKHYEVTHIMTEPGGCHKKVERATSSPRGYIWPCLQLKPL